MYFGSYRLRKPWLDKCLKGLVSEDPSISNMVRGPNTVEVLMAPPLPNLLITVNATDLEKIPLSDIQIFKTVCYHIDSR